MSDPKYVVITAANCAAANRAAALDNMGGFAQDLHGGTDVMAIRYGVVLSGLNPGGLVFVQMYESLSGLEQAMEVIGGSASYASLLKDQNVQPYVRNIAKLAPVPFDNASALPAKYPLSMSVSVPACGISRPISKGTPPLAPWSSTSNLPSQ